MVILPKTKKLETKKKQKIKEGQIMVVQSFQMPPFPHWKFHYIKKDKCPSIHQKWYIAKLCSLNVHQFDYTYKHTTKQYMKALNEITN